MVGVSVSVITAGMLFLGSLLPSACSSTESYEEVVHTPTPSSPSSSTPEPTPSHTPTQSPTPFTPTPTPTVFGLGVSRDVIQIAFEELQLTFEPPTYEGGSKVTVGVIALYDASYVVVILTGPDENLHEASVTIMEPTVRLLFEAESDARAAKTRGKWLFVMQALVDSIFPKWEESSTWLDETLRSFSDLDGAVVSKGTIYQNAIVDMEVELLSGEMEGFLSVALIITAN